MKIYVAHFDHETNTFSPVPTTMERFAGGKNFPAFGEEAYKQCKGTSCSLGAFIDVVEKNNWEMVVGVNAPGAPSGLVQTDAYLKISDYILDTIGDCDAIMLSLHGAMVTQTLSDGEGYLLERIRKQFPHTPMAVALDMHGNLYNRMVINCDIICGFKTYPHIDTYETGYQAGEILANKLKGKCKPTMVWGNAPMIPHVMRQGTDDSPNKELQELCRQYEQQGALAVSLFTGFPHADIKNAGLSVVVVTDNDPKLAVEIKNDLLDKAWKNRKKFVYHTEPLSKTVSDAKKYADSLDPKIRKPVVLLDHYDNTASGGTMETAETFAEVIKQGLESVAFFGIWDPEAVAAMQKVGIGQEIELTLGGKFKIDCFQGKQTQPIRVKGIVKNLTVGRFQALGVMAKGLWLNMGATAVLDMGNIEVVIISRHIEPFDLGCYTSVGIDPTKKKYLLHKSRIHYRTCFMPIVAKVFECCGFGVCTSDYSQLEFKNLRRPIYPLDDFEQPYENLE